MTITAFNLLLGLANTPTASKITQFLMNFADESVITPHFREIQQLYAVNPIACIVLDGTFIVKSNDDRMVQEVMSSALPTLTLLEGKHFRLFQSIYNPPSHECISFPLALEDLPYVIYRTIARFRIHKEPWQRVEHFPAQLDTLFVQYPVRKAHFTYTAILPSIENLKIFIRRVFDTSGRQKTASALFSEFLKGIQIRMERLETYFNFTAPQSLTQSVPDLEVLYRELTAIHLGFEKYKREFHRYKQKDYDPYINLAYDIQLICACLHVFLRQKQ